ncbi:DUF6932 family protein [Paenarthrobacter sp. YIM B13468]|uniref:DUF6932 family protein n=1 Tax=Paenarthrobacter sp. YIM B13468 TaxID=3366295 RepID=UPI00367356FE
MIPSFVEGAKGHQVLPAGAHILTWAELVDAFALGRPDEELRLSQLGDLRDYVRLLTAYGLSVASVIIDGSFASGKTGPGDIDCSPIIDGSASAPIAEIRNNITDNWIAPKGRYKRTPVPGLGRNVGLDIYGVVRIPVGHPNYAVGIENEKHWRKWWQCEEGSKGTVTKGYLEVLIDDAF